MKKRFSTCSIFILVFMLICQNIPVIAERNIKVYMDGIFTIFETVKGVVEGAEDKEIEYVWLSSSSEDGDYTVIEDSYTEKKDELWLVKGTTVKENEQVTINPDNQGAFNINRTNFYGIMDNSFANQWIKLRAVIDGEYYESEPRHIQAKIGNKTATIKNTEESHFPVINKTSPETNIFTVGGVDFILLDVTESSKAKFYVLAKNTYGDRVYYYQTPVNGQKSDEIAYWLNNSFKNDGEGKKIPNVIWENTDNEHWWLIERGLWFHDKNMYEYAVQSGANLITQTDLIKYSHKIGLMDNNADWWLTTPAAIDTNDANCMIFVCGNENSVGRTSYSHAKNSKKAVRPAFYLSENFFKEAKIPLSDMGASVRGVLFSLYNEDELKEIGYTDEEIAEYTNRGITNVSIEGEAKAGKTISAIVENTDVPKEQIEYQWITSNEEDGIYIDIGDAREKSLALSRDMVGSFIKLRVMYGAGYSIESAPVQVTDIWDMTFKGSLKNVSLEGVYETFQTVKGVCDFDEITTEENILEHKWYISSQKNSGYKLIDNADTSEYTIKTDDAEKYIQYEAVLINSKSYKTEPRKIGSAWNESKHVLTNSGNSKLDTVNKTTPSEYTFFADGKEFILLDSFESDASSFLVMAKDSYGTRGTLAGSNFDEMFSWLSQGFLTDGNRGEKLPDNIVGHIDKNQVWKIEKSTSGKTESSHTGAVSLPALTELERYSEKIGLQDNGDWWLRTPASDSGEKAQYVCSSAEKLGMTETDNYTAKKEIRPVFYLDRAYFTEHPISVTASGREVFKTLAERYTKEEMKSFYSEGVLTNLFGYAPEIEIKLLECGGLSGDTATIKTKIISEADREVMVVAAVYSGDKLVCVDCQKTVTDMGVADNLFILSGLPAGEKAVSVYAVENNNGILRAITSSAEK